MQGPPADGGSGRPLGRSEVFDSTLQLLWALMSRAIALIHGRLPVEHISKHMQQKLAHVLDSLDQAGNTRAVGTSTRAVACAFTGGPQPRLFEFAPL